jgi:hypothetical protein
MRVGQSSSIVKRSPAKGPMMTPRREWDWPPTMRHRRRPRGEILPPRQPARARVEITVRHHRRPAPHFLPVFLAVVAVLVLCRFPFGVLMLGALVGWQAIAMFLFVVVIVALIGWREHRAGRPF